METEPAPSCTMGSKTAIFYEGEPVKREVMG